MMIMMMTIIIAIIVMIITIFNEDHHQYTKTIQQKEKVKSKLQRSRGIPQSKSVTICCVCTAIIERMQSGHHIFE